MAMPYKTKFRQINFPETHEEFAALGHDANSWRSFGAALYREAREWKESASPGTFYADNSVPDIVRMLMDAQVGIVEKIVANHMPTSVPAGRKITGYIADGLGRAAKTAGDSQTVEYISHRLQNRKQ